MNNSSAIRLLASANNERGDLFTRLTKDLFFALGYDDLRLDVHKSGRELDIQGEHRFESRRVVGECKAHAAKMGGDELNKFLGALTRERKKCAPLPVAGYFVSLGGFTETGIEQEIETGDDRIILLDSQAVDLFIRFSILLLRLRLLIVSRSRLKPLQAIVNG
jgi:Restriction endonuclease